jgi:hypothetical protein
MQCCQNSGRALQSTVSQCLQDGEDTNDQVVTVAWGTDVNITDVRNKFTQFVRGFREQIGTDDAGDPLLAADPKYLSYLQEVREIAPCIIRYSLPGMYSFQCITFLPVVLLISELNDFGYPGCEPVAASSKLVAECHKRLFGWQRANTDLRLIGVLAQRHFIRFVRRLLHEKKIPLAWIVKNFTPSARSSTAT